MAIAASLSDVVLRPLNNMFTRTIVYVFYPGSYVEAMKWKTRELEYCADGICHRVSLAERRGMQPRRSVLGWLEDIDALSKKSAEVEAYYQSMLYVRGIAKVLGIWARYCLSKRADNIIYEGARLYDRCNFNHVADEADFVRFEEVPCASTNVVGITSYLAKLGCYLNDDSVGIIGVYGMAGVGKTTLLSKFYNDTVSAADDIGLAIYITVTKDIDMDAIQRTVCHRLRLSWDGRTPNERASMLYRSLLSINFVIILDDLWEPINLMMLGIPMPVLGSRSKLIIATRKENICSSMDVQREIKMECLPWEDSWMLFKEKARSEAIASGDIETLQHAEELVSLCGGLPLALVATGRAMASKKVLNEWKHAIVELQEAPWQLFRIDIDVLSHLKDSYDSLPNNELRTCLFYCCLYSNNFYIYKRWIIDYCIGEGLIDGLCIDIDHFLSKGHNLLCRLKEESLLEQCSDEDYIKVHPMVRATVLWVASGSGKYENKMIISHGLGPNEAPIVENWTETEWISLGKNNICELIEKPHCSHLKTLLLQDNPLEKICSGFFECMLTLQVLDLSETLISEVPPCISTLKGLQYLDFGGCKRIQSLPPTLSNLVNLRFLALSRMAQLTTIPSGVISSFIALQVLKMEVSYSDWKVGTTGSGIEFQELEALRRLNVLGITISTVLALEKLKQSKRLARCTERLHIQLCTGLTEIHLPSSEDFYGLKHVRLSDCVDLETVVVSGTLPAGSKASSSYDEPPAQQPSRIEIIILFRLSKAQIVWRGNPLQNLKRLYIYYCKGMGVLAVIHDVNTNEDRVSVFPSLKLLSLVGLPNLYNLSCPGRLLMVFPCLETLEVDKCPWLKTLRLEAEKLKEIKGPQEWWDGLEWGDDNHNQRVWKPLFQQWKFSCTVDPFPEPQQKRPEALHPILAAFPSISSIFSARRSHERQSLRPSLRRRHLRQLRGVLPLRHQGRQGQMAEHLPRDFRHCGI